jgi:phospholipase C
MDDLQQDLQGADFPPVRYVHIEPDYAVFSDYQNGNSQHPLGSVSSGEWFIKDVYETIRNSPVWERSLLIITWDEHGGFYDHVQPPPAVRPGDPPDDPSHNQNGFLFDRLGVRVPAVVISPLIPRNLVDHRTYDHASIPATIEELLGLEPLTDRDRYANSLTTLLTLMTPRTDTPTVLGPPSQARPTAAEPPRKAPPISEGDLLSFLATAVAQDVKVSRSEERAAIFRRVRGIQNHAEALAYMKHVRQKVAALRLNKPTGGA